jgi:hypothetical protein
MPGHLWQSDAMTASLTPLSAAIFLAIGLAAGGLFFALLRWNAALYAQRGPIWRPVLLTLTRLIALGAVLAATAQHGTVALLTATIGVMIARPVVTKLMAP